MPSSIDYISVKQYSFGNLCISAVCIVSLLVSETRMVVSQEQK